MEPVVPEENTTRERALARVLEYRERGRRRPVVARAVLAVVGAVLLVASVPAVIVLPELGVPALLVALRLLAVEADWAAKAYAWIGWRFNQAREWFHRQSSAVRAAVLVALLAAAVALVWLLVHELL
jgi:hypothetical protein